MKERKEVALHVACGDLTDIEIKDGVLSISANDSTILSLLESGKREIERAISWQGLDLHVEIKEKAKEENPVMQDVKKLEKLLGMKLKIKN